MALDRTSPAEAIIAPVHPPVADSLMVPLTVIVLNVLADDAPKMPFAERNHLADAF